MIQLPGLPGIGQAVLVLVFAERQIQLHALAALPCREISRNFDRVEQLAIHRDDDAEQTAGRHGLVGVENRAAACVIEADVELVALVETHRSDRRATDLDATLEQDHLRALSGDRLAHLIAYHAVKRVVRRRRKGRDRAGAKQLQNSQHAQQAHHACRASRACRNQLRGIHKDHLRPLL